MISLEKGSYDENLNIYTEYVTKKYEQAILV